MASKSVKVSADVRREVMCRAGFACELCGGKQLLGNIHHRTPRGMGGTRDTASSSPANLLFVCGSGTTGCHGYIESHREEAYESGWLVKRGADPRIIPFLDKKGVFWLISDSGTKERAETVDS